MDERAHHHLIIPQQDKYGGGGHLKTNALLLVEWSIYHGLKWCLSPTKVLIIPSEEELPAHYLPGNNNADTRPPGPPPGLPGVACRSLSAAAPFIQSQQAASCRIHSPSCTISPSFQPLSPYAASHYLPALCRLPPPPATLSSSSPAKPSTLTSSHSASLRCPTPPPLLVLMSHCEIQADGWGTKG